MFIFCRPLFWNLLSWVVHFSLKNWFRVALFFCRKSREHLISGWGNSECMLSPVAVFVKSAAGNFYRSWNFLVLLRGKIAFCHGVSREKHNKKHRGSRMELPWVFRVALFEHLAKPATRYEAEKVQPSLPLTEMRCFLDFLPIWFFFNKNRLFS